MTPHRARTPSQSKAGTGHRAMPRSYADPSPRSGTRNCRLKWTPKVKRAGMQQRTRPLRSCVCGCNILSRGSSTRLVETKSAAFARHSKRRDLAGCRGGIDCINRAPQKSRFLSKATFPTQRVLSMLQGICVQCGIQRVDELGQEIDFLL